MCSTDFSAAGSATALRWPKSPLALGPGIEVTVTVVIVAGVNPNSFRIEKHFEGRRAGVGMRSLG